MQLRLVPPSAAAIERRPSSIGVLEHVGEPAACQQASADNAAKTRRDIAAPVASTAVALPRSARGRRRSHPRVRSPSEADPPGRALNIIPWPCAWRSRCRPRTVDGSTRCRRGTVATTEANHVAEPRHRRHVCSLVGRSRQGDRQTGFELGLLVVTEQRQIHRRAHVHRRGGTSATKPETVEPQPSSHIMIAASIGPEPTPDRRRACGSCRAACDQRARPTVVPVGLERAQLLADQRAVSRSPVTHEKIDRRQRTGTRMRRSSTDSYSVRMRRHVSSTADLRSPGS